MEPQVEKYFLEAGEARGYCGRSASVALNAATAADAFLTERCGSFFFFFSPFLLGEEEFLCWTFSFFSFFFYYSCSYSTLACG